MDAILICGSNVLFENFAAFAVFGVVGFLERWPQDGVRLGAFVVGFLTLPEAVLQMPGANFWAFLLFFTLIVLGFSSAFVMLDVVATVIIDSGLTKLRREWIVTILTLLCFLMCLPYCTEFGYYLLDGIDRWVNNVVLIFVVWSEVMSATTVYRWQDVAAETGKLSFYIYNFGYIGGQILGVGVAHATSSPGAGVGAGVGLWFVCSIVVMVIGKTPTRSKLNAPFWSKNKITLLLRDGIDRFYYVAFYSGNQLKRDLNAIVGGGQNWNIPVFWPFLLRYISAPVLAIVFSFSYPEFHQLRYDPLMILGFTVAHIGLAIILLGWTIPRYYAVFVPPDRRHEGTETTIVGEIKSLEGTLPVVEVSSNDEEAKAKEEESVKARDSSEERGRL
jgi:solute carrier family 6 GABA transporter-like protein 1